jgi:NADPH-dependent 2,4-dienoyl-CoA reductase/sulfur reductase-like enzyme
MAMREIDVAVIGAGPAGMAAATVAARAGLRTVILDEQATPGGQIYRSVSAGGAARGDILGQDYLDGARLVDELLASGAERIDGATVWNVEADGTVTWSRNGRARQARARRIIVATGTVERAVPVPGWTLPGVMTVGAGQILLKQSGVVPRRAVIAGCGPLIYLFARQLIRAGTPPLALVETQDWSAMRDAIGHVGGAIRGWRYLAKGMAMLRDIRGAGVRRYTGCRSIRIKGEAHAEGISFLAGGRQVDIPCDTVLLHQGVIPNTQITRALRADHVWDDRQHCFRPALDEWGRTSLPGIYVAGDGAGIGGAKAAALRGALSAWHAARSLDAISEAELSARNAEIEAALAAELAVRPFLDALYPPAPEALRPHDEVIVCRCEEVTAGTVRRLAREGCVGPNQMKAFTRCGMGPCQGRYCGPVVTNLLAEVHERSPSEIGGYHIRAPLKPITLGELASLEGEDRERPDAA